MDSQQGAWCNLLMFTLAVPHGWPFSGFLSIYSSLSKTILRCNKQIHILLLRHIHLLSWQFLNLLSYNNPNLTELKKIKIKSEIVPDIQKQVKRIIVMCEKSFIFFCDLVDLTLCDLYCKKYNITRIQEINNKKLITCDNLFVLNLELTWHLLLYSLSGNCVMTRCTTQPFSADCLLYVTVRYKCECLSSFIHLQHQWLHFWLLLDLVSGCETSEAQTQCLIKCSQGPLLWW